MGVCMTGPALAIIDLCSRLGVALQADAGRLRFRPADAVDDALRNELRQHKGVILRALAGQDEAPAPAAISADVRETLLSPDILRPLPPPVQWDVADRAAVDATLGLREPWRPRSSRTVPGVPEGWAAAAWVRRLRYLADCCQEIRPDLAERHRAEAQRITGELGQ
jgi:hypothetical protein